jgi:hypothetical protein
LRGDATSLSQDSLCGGSESGSSSSDAQLHSSSAEEGAKSKPRSITAPPQMQEGAKLTLACPVRQHDIFHGVNQHDCCGANSRKMADLRAHLTARRNGRSPHVAFIGWCPVCSEDFLDKEEFEKYHGYKGRNCTRPPARKRGGLAVRTQWEKLYRKLYPMDNEVPCSCTYPVIHHCVNLLKEALRSLTI